MLKVLTCSNFVFQPHCDPGSGEMYFCSARQHRRLPPWVLLLVSACFCFAVWYFAHVHVLNSVDKILRKTNENTQTFLFRLLLLAVAIKLVFKDLLECRFVAEDWMKLSARSHFFLFPNIRVNTPHLFSKYTRTNIIMRSRKQRSGLSTDTFSLWSLQLMLERGSLVVQTWRHEFGLLFFHRVWK